MKVKYLRLSKKERKKAKDKFYQTENGKFVKKKLTYALVCAVLCTVMAIYITAEAFIINSSTWDKAYGICLLIIGIILLIAYRKIYVKKINDFITSKKKS